VLLFAGGEESTEGRSRTTCRKRNRSDIRSWALY